MALTIVKPENIKDYIGNDGINLIGSKRLYRKGFRYNRMVYSRSRAN